MIDLIRDVLDKQVVDRNERRMGKVDGIIFEVREGQPPRLKFIEVGWPTRVRRLRPAIADWLARHGAPSVRFPWKAIRDIGVDIEVDVDAGQTPLLDFEKRLRRILMRIPGA